MGLLDDIIINAKTAATTVGVKAGQIKEYSKLKYSESGIKGEINKKKQELGEYVYKCTLTGDIDNEKLQKMVDDITELEENLQITREMLTIAKNKVVCNSCKAENDKDSVFCCKCGKKLNKNSDSDNAVADTDDECGDVTVAAASSVDDVTCQAVEDVNVVENEVATEVTEDASAKDNVSDSVKAEDEIAE